MSEYVPTTEEVERACVRSTGPARFYAWLAAHDAEVAAKALEDAADRCPLPTVGDWLRARAAEYRKAVQDD